jgi:hypothetical protein
MKPYRSNTEKESCSPVSSNCVTWQGPDLPCLNLCKGDSVSDVVYKIAVEICDLKDSIGLSDVDLTCLVQVCSTTPEPTKTLAHILDLLISKVCCLADIVDNLPTPGNNYVEPTLNLPACLQYSNGSGGNVTQLILSQYTLRIATVLCSTITTVNAHTGSIASLETRVYALEHPNIIVPTLSSCLLGSVQTIPTILQNLETEFCDYTPVLGTPNQITSAIAKQNAGICPTNWSNERLLSTGAYVTSLGVNNWKSSPTNIGDSLTNVWAMICDLRATLKAVLANCCQVDCDSIVISFNYKWIDQYTLRMYFFPNSSLPLGFYDCDDAHGNPLTITDGNGIEWTTYVHFRRADPLDLTGIFDDTAIIQYGFDLDLSLSPLDATTGLYFNSNLCFTNGDTNCIKCFTKTVVPYINKDCCTITASKAVTITYKTCPTSTTTTSSSTTIAQ